MHSVAKAYSQRPSSLVSVRNSWLAYCLDSACFLFGSHVEVELAKIEGKTQAERERNAKARLTRLLSDEQQDGTFDAGSFADPALFMGG